MDGGVVRYVNALAVSGSDLYAGGYFTMAGGVSANRIAKWNGSAWSALGSGMDNDVYALATDGFDHLFVGGLFHFAGTTVSPFVAQGNLAPDASTSTPTSMPTGTPTDTTTATETPTSTGTDTPIVTDTATDTPTAAATATPTNTGVASATASPTESVTTSPSDTPTPTPFISGSLLCYGSANPVQNAVVDGRAVVGGPVLLSTTSDAAGSFAMPNGPPGSWVIEPHLTDTLTSILRGVSSLDATRIQEVMVGERTFTANQQLAGDTTGNGALSSLDAVRIQELRVGSLSRLPVAANCDSDWAFVPTPAPLGNPTPVAPVLGPGSACQMGRIEYASSPGAAGGQDFEAVLFGDTTGSWTPPSGASLDSEPLISGAASAADALDSAPVSLATPPQCDGPCAVAVVDDGSVVIGVNHLAAAQAFDLAVILPPGLEVTAVRKAEVVPEGCSLVWNVRDGEVLISLACVEPVTGGGALVAVQVDGNGASAGARVSRCVLNEGELPCATR